MLLLLTRSALFYVKMAKMLDTETAILKRIDTRLAHLQQGLAWYE